MRRFLLAGKLSLALLLATTTFSQTFKPFTAAQGFNVFVLKDLTAKGGDTHGPVAMGRDLLLQGSTIFTMNTSGTYPTNTLNDPNNYGIVIGSQVNFSSGNQSQVNQGYLRIGNTTGTTLWYNDNNGHPTNLKLNTSSGNFDSNPSVILQRQQSPGTATDPHGLNFAAAFSNLTATAAKINSWNTSNSSFLNKLTIPAGNNPHIQLVDNKINYINLTATELTNLNSQNSIVFDNAPAINRPVIFNIQLSGDFTWIPPNFGGLSEANGDFIIWNFYSAAAVNLNLSGSNNIYGSIFSPRADIVKNNANNLNGQVISNSLVIVTGEIHYHPFITDRPDIPEESPLGIKSITLTGNLNNNISLLNWTVYEETDIVDYEIEKSTDGVTFSVAGAVGSRGNNQRANYSFTENISASSAAVIYYRIHAKEINGAGYYSKTIAIRKAMLTTAMNVWPNPVTDHLIIGYSSAIDQPVSLQLFDTRGALVRSVNYVFSKGANQVTLQGLGSLNSGLYTLKLTDKNSQLLSVKQISK